MTADPASSRPDAARPADDDLLYSQPEIRRALQATMLHHPAFTYYPEPTRAAMLEAVLANVDEHAPSRIQPADYLKRLRTELRRLQDPASLGREAALSAVRLGGRALLDRALNGSVRAHSGRVVQEPKGGLESPLPEVLYTRAALETGLRETLRRHPQFGHYPQATRQELQEALLEALNRAAPRRLTYGAFLREMLERARLQDAAEPLGVLASAVKGAATGAGRSLLGGLKRRVHEYTASPDQKSPNARPAPDSSPPESPVLKKPEHG
ncbi:hypothetical protein [Deinococcus sp.]|uniref:hypothetical protein n=1 Tax=Deinococcus sp. TaxID=47478 RepID=UPI003C7D3993